MVFLPAPDNEIIGGRPGPGAPQKPQAPSISDDLSAFMLSVRHRSGNNYASVGGAYGFSNDRWDTLAEGAGLKGARILDFSAQDYVAAYWFNAYFNKYQNWTLVAIAWNQGTGTVTNLMKKAGKEPSAITLEDVKNYAPGSYEFAAAIIGAAEELTGRGWVHGLDEAIPRNQAPRRIITGTGNVNIGSPYADTVNELVGQLEAEEYQRRPSGAEMLFSQLESLSSVVTGGVGRVDWRNDFSEVQSGGSVQELPDLARPENE